MKINPIVNYNYNKLPNRSFKSNSVTYNNAEEANALPWKKVADLAVVFGVACGIPDMAEFIKNSPNNFSKISRIVLYAGALGVALNFLLNDLFKLFLPQDSDKE